MPQEKPENSRLGWSATEIAFLNFMRLKGLTYNQIAEVLHRSATGTAQMGMKILQFEKGLHNQGKYLTDKIKRGLQMAFQVANDSRYLDHRQAWFDKMSAVTHISYFVSPQAIAKNEAEKANGEAVEQVVTPKTEVEPDNDTEVNAERVVEIKISLTAEQLGQVLSSFLGK